MALTIDATPKGVSSNSYATEVEANAYNEAHVSGASWFSATDEKKKAGLIMATRLIDSMLIWNGYRTDRDQALSWPRGPLYNEDGIEVDAETIPQFLINATAELARRLLTEDATANPDTKGFSEIAVGPIKLKIDKLDAERIVLTDDVMSFIGFYGRKKSGAGTNVDLARA